MEIVRYNLVAFLTSPRSHNPYLKTLRRSIASLAPTASLSDHVILSVSLCRLLGDTIYTGGAI